MANVTCNYLQKHYVCIVYYYTWLMSHVIIYRNIMYILFMYKINQIS